MWSVGTILNGLLSFMTDTAQVLQVIATTRLSVTVYLREPAGVDCAPSNADDRKHEQHARRKAASCIGQPGIQHKTRHVS